MKNIICLLGFFFPVLVLCQQPTIEWQVSLGGSDRENAYVVTEGNDGGYFIAGVTESEDGDVFGHHGNGDFWAVKLDDIGNIQWQSCLGGSELDIGTAAVVGLNGGYVITGWTISNDGDVSGNHGDGFPEYSPDIWVVKIDDFGDIEWQKCYGGSYSERPSDIIKVEDGYVIAGSAGSLDGDVSNNNGISDSWVFKIDEVGNLEWEKNFGGPLIESAEAIIQTSDGGYLLANTSNSFGGLWIVKIDSLRNLEWEKSYEGSSAGSPSDVVQCDDGGYVISGSAYYDQHNGLWDVGVIKIDEDGTIVWEKRLGGSGHDYGYSLATSPYGGYIICCESYSNNGDVSGNHGESDFWLVELDEEGEFIWQKCFGGSAEELFPQLTIVGEDLMLTGTTASDDGDITENKGRVDIWVAKLSFPSVGIVEPVFNELMVNPNPVANELVVNIPVMGMYQVRFFDTSGHLIYQRSLTVTDFNVSINVSQLLPGSYLFTISNSNTKYSGRFIKL